MAFTFATSFLFSLIVIFIPQILSVSVIEDLNNQYPPPDFNATISNNCFNNPSLRYCNSSPTDLLDIFKSTIVANHLCNESKNPNCVDSFTKIDLQNHPKIAPLYLSFTFFWKYCPLTITAIDLSNNSVKGNFPTEILLCSQIQALDLRHNDFTGDVPLQSLSSLTNLTHLNLSYNHFSESKISDMKFFERFNSTSFLHSGLLPDHKKFKIKVVVILIGFPIMVVLMVICCGCLCFRRRDILPSILQKRFTFTPAMLKVATRKFSEEYLVGKTEEIDIYKGMLRDGTEVRIEIYKEKISMQFRKKFVEECKILVQFHHKNLVQVLGWCDNREIRALVTEWSDGKNIETWLSEFPPWNHRLKILMGIVEGMCYLEEQWPEVGYDLRTTSVLLSKDQEPLISRFKVGNQNSNPKKIYKFGVLLLEMVSNRRPREEFEGGEKGFIEWMRMHYPEKVGKVIIDEKMKKTGIVYEQAKQGIGLALMCTGNSTDCQPSLEQISDMITRAYDECCLVQESIPSSMRPHKERV